MLSADPEAEAVAAFSASKRLRSSNVSFLLFFVFLPLVVPLRFLTHVEQYQSPSGTLVSLGRSLAHVRWHSLSHPSQSNMGMSTERSSSWPHSQHVDNSYEPSLSSSESESARSSLSFLGGGSDLEAAFFLDGDGEPDAFVFLGGDAFFLLLPFPPLVVGVWLSAEVALPFLALPPPAPLPLPFFPLSAAAFFAGVAFLPLPADEGVPFFLLDSDFGFATPSSVPAPAEAGWDDGAPPAASAAAASSASRFSRAINCRSVSSSFRCSAFVCSPVLFLTDQTST